MDRALRLAPLLVAALLPLWTPSSNALLSDGPCLGPETPPTIQLNNCGPAAPEVQVTVQFSGPAVGTQQIVIGECDDVCDLRVDIVVIACKSTDTIATPRGTETVIEGEMTLTDKYGRAISQGYSHHQAILIEGALFPQCLEDELS